MCGNVAVQINFQGIFLRINGFKLNLRVLEVITRRIAIRCYTDTSNTSSIVLPLPHLLSSPLFFLPSLVFLRTHLGRIHYQKCRGRSSERGRSTERNREKEIEGVFSLINSTAGFLGFTESWDLIDDGLLTCGDSRTFYCGSHSNSV